MLHQGAKFVAGSTCPLTAVATAVITTQSAKRGVGSKEEQGVGVMSTATDVVLGALYIEMKIILNLQYWISISYVLLFRLFSGAGKRKGGDAGEGQGGQGGLPPVQNSSWLQQLGALSSVNYDSANSANVGSLPLDLAPLRFVWSGNELS